MLFHHTSSFSTGFSLLTISGCLHCFYTIFCCFYFKFSSVKANFLVIYSNLTSTPQLKSFRWWVIPTALSWYFRIFSFWLGCLLPLSFCFMFWKLVLFQAKSIRITLNSSLKFENLPFSQLELMALRCYAYTSKFSSMYNTLRPRNSSPENWGSSWNGDHSK